jgi:nicotinate dehydrogenase subunit A
MVNGHACSITPAPDAMLLDVLRTELGLNAARFGCGEGLCGACRVLVDGQPVQACDTPLWSVEGRAITTVEGLGTTDVPHPLQSALIAEQAAIREALDGNLCRCGAHNRIVRAVQRAAAEMRAGAA